MHVFLFILYAAVACHAIPRLPFFRNSGLKPGFLVAFFLLRVATGCLHNFIAWRCYPHHGDIWLYFQDSFITRGELYSGFRVFWADNSRFIDLPHNIIEWLHLVFNYLSFDNLYINTLLFNILTLSGQIALFQVCRQRLGKDALAALPALLLPSVLFWTSCIDTEGLVYALLGWLFYTQHRGLTKGWNPQRVLACILLTGLAIFFRPALLPGLLPALLIWYIVETRIPRRKLLTGLVACGAVLTALICWHPGLVSLVPRVLSARQHAFQALQGNSRIPLPLLAPDWHSLWSILPRAIFNGFFQPLPGTGGQPIYLAFTAELMAIWAVILVSLLFRSRPVSGLRAKRMAERTAERTTDSVTERTTEGTTEGMTANMIPGVFGWGCLIFSLAGMILVGAIVPFAGAIIRYRSLYLPFLLIPFLYRLRPVLPGFFHRDLKNYILK